MQIRLKKSMALLGFPLLLAGCLDHDSLKKLYVASPQSKVNQEEAVDKSDQRTAREAERAARQRLELERAQRQAEVQAEIARRERRALDIQREAQQRLDLQEAQRRAEEQTQNARRERLALEAARNAEIQAQNARRERLALEAQREEAQRQADLQAERTRQEHLAQEAARAEQERRAREQEARRAEARESSPPSPPQQDIPLPPEHLPVEEILPATGPEVTPPPAHSSEAIPEQEAPPASPRPWEPNSGDLRLGGETVMQLQRNLGRIPSHAEMCREIVAIQGLSTEQAEAVLDLMGL